MKDSVICILNSLVENKFFYWINVLLTKQIIHVGDAYYLVHWTGITYVDKHYRVEHNTLTHGAVSGKPYGFWTYLENRNIITTSHHTPIPEGMVEHIGQFANIV